MEEHAATVKLEADSLEVAAQLKLACQISESKPDSNKAQVWTRTTTCSKVSQQVINETQGGNQKQGEKEQDTVNMPHEKSIVKNVVARDSENNSDLVQSQQMVKQEDIEHEQTSSDIATKYATESQAGTMSEKVSPSDTGGGQAGLIQVHPQNEENDDDYSESSSKSELEDENDSDFECSKDESQDSNKDGKTRLRNRVPPARTAREFIARLHQKQDEAAQNGQNKRQKKRKAEGCKGNTAKKSKTTNTSSGSDVVAYLTHDMLGESQEAEPPAPAIPEIDADTHRKQFALLRDSIPKGVDTRRTQTQSRDLKEAAKLFGYKKVKASSGHWLLKGMKTALYGHQLTAAAWMVKRECARAGPYGGLIADEMGMGKTMTSLACVLGNPPEPEDLTTYVQGTLVIAPNVAVAEQWASEIKKHCIGSIADYAMVYKPKNNMSAAMCQSLVIMITTTKEVQGYFQRVQTNKTREVEALGFTWYRIILDEAHSMKNLKSLTKKSMCSLKAKHLWALTGTPLSNSATELISYLRFIGFDVEESKRKFRKEYMNANKANEKFEALISSFMYRRTKHDKFLGHAILPIPSVETHDIWVPLTVEEEAIYSFMKTQQLSATTQLDQEQDKKKKPKKAKKKAVVDKREKEATNKNPRRCHMYIRHLISHPYNIERWLRSMEEASQIQELRDEIKKREKAGTVLEQILSDEDARSSLQKYQSGLAEMKKYTNSAFGGALELDDHLFAIQKELQVRDMKCTKCHTRNPKHAVTPPECRHVYCEACFTKMIEPQRFGKQTSANSLTCTARGCTSPSLPGTKFLTMSSIVDDALAKAEYPPPDIDDNKTILPRDKDQIGCFIASCLSTTSPMAPNSRLTTAMTVLLSWHIDHPDDKIIVFTQNVMTAKVLGTMLNHAHIGFVYYYGCISPGKKAKALALFRASPSTKVFLSGLKSGGQSLNITCANRVIIIDPWWNVTSELQAAGRTSRIGQTKNCHVVRIFTSAAADERVAELQKCKSEEIDHALQDDGHVPQLLDDEESLELLRRTHGLSPI